MNCLKNPGMLQNIYVLLKSDSHIDETVLNEWLQTEEVLNDDVVSI